MGSITERSISAYLTITHLIISTIIHIEHYRSISSNSRITQTITPWTILGYSTRTPLVNLYHYIMIII